MPTNFMHKCNTFGKTSKGLSTKYPACTDPMPLKPSGVTISKTAKKQYRDDLTRLLTSVRSGINNCGNGNIGERRLKALVERRTKITNALKEKT